jgi:lysozyme
MQIKIPVEPSLQKKEEHPMFRLSIALVSVAALLGACGSSGLQQEEVSSSASALTPDYKVCPGSTTIAGVDVSDYDGTIDWKKVAASGKQFAIIRLGDGLTYIDTQFAINWAGAKAAGLTVGAYQFFRPEDDPVAQADLMLSHLAAVGYVAGDIPPVVDVEVTDGQSNATVLANVDAWLQRIKAKTGRLPVMYSSARVWSLIGNPNPSPLPYLWDAQWGVTCPTLPPEWGRLRFWQYTDSGSVPGIGDAADLDLYNGSLAELRGL